MYEFNAFDWNMIIIIIQKSHRDQNFIIWMEKNGYRLPSWETSERILQNDYTVQLIIFVKKKYA